jgi:hypothetical protein
MPTIDFKMRCKYLHYVEELGPMTSVYFEDLDDNSLHSFNIDDLAVDLDWLEKRKDYIFTIRYFSEIEVWEAAQT